MGCTPPTKKVSHDYPKSPPPPPKVEYYREGSAQPKTNGRSDEVSFWLGVLIFLGLK